MRLIVGGREHRVWMVGSRVDGRPALRETTPFRSQEPARRERRSHAASGSARKRENRRHRTVLEQNGARDTSHPPQPEVEPISGSDSSEPRNHLLSTLGDSRLHPRDDRPACRDSPCGRVANLGSGGRACVHGSGHRVARIRADDARPFGRERTVHRRKSSRRDRWCQASRGLSAVVDPSLSGGRMATHWTDRPGGTVLVIRKTVERPADRSVRIREAFDPMSLPVHRVSAAAHAEISHANPLSPAQMAQLAEWAAQWAPATAIDIGCGPGSFSIGLATRCPVRVRAIDPNPHFLERARLEARSATLLGSIDFLERSLREDEGGCFDVVVCLGSSGAVGSPREALLRCKQLLSRTGVIVFADLAWRCEPPRD
ncbi:MAG: hypothetical protein RL136_1982, partial [Planctomycetota bacterium]